MRLLDVATVVTSNGHVPEGFVSRLCAIAAQVEQICDPADSIEVYAEGGTVGTVYSPPFGITGHVVVPVACAQPDDQEFLSKAMEPVTERALGLYLVTAKTDTSRFWIGDAGITEAVDITSARTAVYNAGPIEQAILHADPETLPQLISDNIVKVSGDENEKHYTVWGEPVVLNQSYVGMPAFWTGPITVNLSSVHTERGDAARANSTVLDAYRSASIEIDSCTVVRAGAMPA